MRCWNSRKRIKDRMENKQNQFTINNNYRSKSVTRISELPDYPVDETIVGLLLGVSRNRPPSKAMNYPYTLHMTDFSDSRFKFPQYFDGRDFKKKELQHKTFDVVTFPAVFDTISKDVRDIVDLHGKVRYYKFQNGRPYYEDEWNQEDLDVLYLKLGIENKLAGKELGIDYWLLDKFQIWIKVRIRGKRYKEQMELVCMNNFYVIPELILQRELRSYGQQWVWEEFVRVYNHKDLLDEDFSDSDVETPSTAGETPRREKRRKLALVEERPQQREKDTARRFDDIQYTLVSELADDNVWAERASVQYAPQYILVRRVRIWKKLDSYVYMHRRALGVKRAKFVVADERGHELVLTIRENCLTGFLGLSIGDFKFFEDLNEAIKTRVEQWEGSSGSADAYHGMVVSRARIAPGVHKWCWEYTTAEPVPAHQHHTPSRPELP